MLLTRMWVIEDLIRSDVDLHRHIHHLRTSFESRFGSSGKKIWTAEWKSLVNEVFCGVFCFGNRLLSPWQTAQSFSLMIPLNDQVQNLGTCNPQLCSDLSIATELVMGPIPVENGKLPRARLLWVSTILCL
jgi:hypothetical protein